MTGPLCNGCSVDVRKIHELSYMLRTTLWNAVEPTGRGFLCIGCIEERIGREIDLHDFAPLAINSLPDGFLVTRSERLMARLRGFREWHGIACGRSMREIDQVNRRIDV